MSTVTIFVIGVFVTLITTAALVMVGLSEAADPAHARSEDLTDWERSLVEREREKRAADRQGER